MDPFTALFAFCGQLSPYPRELSPYSCELHGWSFVWKFLVCDLEFDRKKGYDIKISWRSFVDLVNDGIYLLKLRAVTWCLEVVGVFNVQDALEYWISGRFPLMKVSFHNNTLWARCFQEERNVRNMK